MRSSGPCVLALQTCKAWWGPRLGWGLGRRGARSAGRAEKEHQVWVLQSSRLTADESIQLTDRPNSNILIHSGYKWFINSKEISLCWNIYNFQFSLCFKASGSVRLLYMLCPWEATLTVPSCSPLRSPHWSRLWKNHSWLLSLPLPWLSSLAFSGMSVGMCTCWGEKEKGIL